MERGREKEVVEVGVGVTEKIMGKKTKIRRRARKDWVCVFFF
jgi:hypothetical protein